MVLEVIPIVFDTDTPLGSDVIVETGSGVDTIDFSSTTTLPVALNLGLGTAQAVNPNLTLALSSGATIENLLVAAKTIR